MALAASSLLQYSELGSDISSECSWLDYVGNIVDMDLWKTILTNLRGLREERPSGGKPATMCHGEERMELGIFT